jgi:hypothetical protein
MSTPAAKARHRFGPTEKLKVPRRNTPLRRAIRVPADVGWNGTEAELRSLHVTGGVRPSSCSLAAGANNRALMDETGPKVP